MDQAQSAQEARQYVDVIARWRDDGRVVPLEIILPDGRTYQIQRVVGEAASTAFPYFARVCRRYRVVIDGVEKQLFAQHDRDAADADTVRWYVYAKPDCKPSVFGRGEAPAL